ncbi:MAG: hypothetical protein R2820_05580 [Cyclobacteriaceae bacterium]|nr:hypothetical protein [Cyclobacteriaceae bacterium]
MANQLMTRRSLIKGSLIGIAGTSLSSFALGNLVASPTSAAPGSMLSSSIDNYPALAYEQINQVVGASHGNFDRVKELVSKRPELARASWDWRFGDFESALGAASHVGRRDIAMYLMSNGARPNIFTYAMMGAYDAVRSMIEFSPGIQRNLGPHGISLLRHAKAGLRMEDTMSKENLANLKMLITYLESLGDANGDQYEDLTEEEKKMYLGNYRYGEGESEGFSIKLNSFNIISLGPLGSSGGALYKIGENKFFHNGTPSTTVSFQIEKDQIRSLTITDPDRVVIAKRL